MMRLTSANPLSGSRRLAPRSPVMRLEGAAWAAGTDFHRLGSPITVRVLGAPAAARHRLDLLSTVLMLAAELMTPPAIDGLILDHGAHRQPFGP